MCYLTTHIQLFCSISQFHLHFRTAHFQNRQSPREKPNFHHIFSVSIHDAVFDTFFFIPYMVQIPLHLLVLDFLP